MIGNEAAKQMVLDDCMGVAARVADATFLEHPLPWDQELSDEIEKQVIEAFDTVLADHPMVSDTIEASSLRAAVLSAFRERIGSLAFAGATTGNA